MSVEHVLRLLNTYFYILCIIIYQVELNIEFLNLTQVLIESNSIKFDKVIEFEFEFESYQL